MINYQCNYLPQLTTFETVIVFIALTNLFKNFLDVIERTSLLKTNPTPEETGKSFALGDKILGRRIWVAIANLFIQKDPYFLVQAISFRIRQSLERQNKQKIQKLQVSKKIVERVIITVSMVLSVLQQLLGNNNSILDHASICYILGDLFMLQSYPDDPTMNDQIKKRNNVTI